MYAVCAHVGRTPARGDAVRVAGVDVVPAGVGGRRREGGGEGAEGEREDEAGTAHGANSPPPVAGAAAGVVDCGCDGAGCSKVNSAGALSCTGSGAAVSWATAGSVWRRRGLRSRSPLAARSRLLRPPLCASAAARCRGGGDASGRLGSRLGDFFGSGVDGPASRFAVRAPPWARARGELDDAGDDADGAGAEAAQAEADDGAEGGDAAAAGAGADLRGGDDVGAAQPVQPAVEVGLELEPAARRSAAAWSAAGSRCSTAS